MLGRAAVSLKEWEAVHVKLLREIGSIKSLCGVFRQPLCLSLGQTDLYFLLNLLTCINLTVFQIINKHTGMKCPYIMYGLSIQTQDSFFQVWGRLFHPAISHQHAEAKLSSLLAPKDGTLQLAFRSCSIRRGAERMDGVSP